MRVHLLIKGRVQGVGFRWFARETAQRLNLSGWVRNLAGGDVEAEAEGSHDSLKDFVRELKTGLPYARVDDIAQREIPSKGDKEPFDIH